MCYGGPGMGSGPQTYNNRRVFGQNAVDWQEGINFDKLRKKRLERAREKMEEHDLGALVCFNGGNVRYITSSWQGVWKDNINVRYTVLPRGGDPVLFETAGADRQCAVNDATWLRGNIKPAITWVWSGSAMPHQAKKMAEGVKEVLEENGVSNEKIGVDTGNFTAQKAFTDVGLDIVDAWPAMKEARLVKTEEEIELIKQSVSMAGCAFSKIKNEWLKPGIRESELAGKYSDFLISNGFSYIPALIVASGANTNPYRRWATNKMIREGDHVIIDIAAPGPGGYFEDYTRTFICGDSNPTKEGKEAYQETYDSLQASMDEFKSGATTKDVAEKLPPYEDDEYGTCSLFQFAHSIGLSLYEGRWISRGYSLEYPDEIKKNMVFAVETYSGSSDRKQGARLEQNIVVTDSGYELLSTYPFENAFLD